MANSTADVVICGAGIAGVSAAYHLAAQHGIRRVVLVDERAPLSLTSDKSTEAYRNWWPGPGDEMVSFMNRSIDLLEGLAQETDNRFLMNRRGYAFLTADRSKVRQMQHAAAETSRLGAGPLRCHPGATPSMPAPAEAKVILTRLGQLAGLSLPADWESRTRNQKRDWANDQVEAVYSAINVAYRWVDNDGSWPRFEDYLENRGLRVKQVLG